MLAPGRGIVVQCGMARIRELPPEVYRKIAAGEVVERPLSVVKELVENSLDAGADHIHVELDDGGRKGIRVSDNGCGFQNDEIALAFKRHSTSKLSEIADLDQLTTLGFRGEALASLREVARIHVVSADQEGSGAELELAPGEDPRVRAVPSPRGTRIKVSDLFFNFPVRRKFLKSARTETNRVVAWLEGMALAWWKVSFQLDHNGRTIFAYPGVDSLMERVYQVMGRETAATLTQVSGDAGNGTINGLVSRPRTGGTDRRRQFFFVNRRPVKEKTLMAALHNAAAPFLEKGKHPVAVFLLDIPPDEVDVNIHPMKLEIRFRDQQAAFRLVYHAVTAALGGREAGVAVPRAPGMHRTPGASHTMPPNRPFAAAEESGAPQAGSGIHESVLPFPEGDPRIGGVRVLGQYHDAYIVVEHRGELLLVDQHNAHERVLYERLRRQAADMGVETAAPLFPMVLELSATERGLLDEEGENLARLGFELEFLGGASVAVRRYPRLLPESRIADALRAALRPAGGEPAPGEDMALAGVACQAAIKVNQPLNQAEMQRLVDDLFACENPGFCPHRRPIVVHFTLEEIEKRVGRR